MIENNKVRISRGKPEVAVFTAVLFGRSLYVSLDIKTQHAVKPHDDAIDAYVGAQSLIFPEAWGPIAVAQHLIGTESWVKAGGYGIKGSAASFIVKINGSYTGVMGLPIYETTQLLRLL